MFDNYTDPLNKVNLISSTTILLIGKWWGRFRNGCRDLVPRFHHFLNKHLLIDDRLVQMNMSRDMGFPTMWYVRPAKPQISLRSLIRAFASRLNIL